MPNLDSPVSAVTDNSGKETASADNASPQTSADSNKKAKKADNIAQDNDEDKSVGIGSYPAVTAMETKLLGKDHSQEPIQDRLARLEKKVLGSVSRSDDLSDRVDKLKTATGIDITRKPGSLNDWIEDDEDTLGRTPSGRSLANSGFGQPDTYKDLQQGATGSLTPYAPSQNSFASPYFPDEGGVKKGGISIKSFGLSQQVTALEHEVFGKSYEHDPLPARVNRLESTIFPEQKPAVDKSLPERVNILLAKVPIRQEELQHLAKIYNIQPDNNLADNTDPNSLNSIQKSHSNLNKLLNQLGNMLSGGGMQGGYPMQSGQYVMDPNTGMLVNPSTGTVINPNTGTVYGGRNMSPYGISPNSYNNYNSYYNNMYPFGSPYGAGAGSGFSMGGMGMGFGFR